MSARDELRRYVNLMGDIWTSPKVTDERVERLYAAVRAEVLAEADARFAAMTMPEYLQQTLNAGSYKDAWQACRRIVQTMAEEKTTPVSTTTTEAAVTPELNESLRRLADHILAVGGEWSTGRAHRWLVADVDPGCVRYRARHALQHLAALGYLVERDGKNGRTYTPNYARGDA